MLNLVIMVFKNREEEIEMPQQIALFTHHPNVCYFYFIIIRPQQKDKKYEK